MKVNYTQAFCEWLNSGGHSAEKKRLLKDTYDNLTTPHTKPEKVETTEFLFLVGEYYKANPQ